MSGNSISDLAAKCIRCGFCLESCPTFLETGEEAESPRGRIYLMKSADRGEVAWEDIRKPLDHCLGCRGCETACPSGVEYGHLLELGRSRLGSSATQKLATNLATQTGLLRIAKVLGIKRMPRWLASRLSADHHIPPAISFETLEPADEDAQAPVQAREAVFLEGCAMRVLFPGVHQASKRLLQLAGYRILNDNLGCCGALHAHAGMLELGASMATRVKDVARSRTVVSDSAGCGAWLKDQGVATMDLSEALVDLDLSGAHWDGVVTYHDACHLAHGQGIRSRPRDLIQRVRGVQFVELNEADLCCGSAGTYNLTQPAMARQLLDRKWKNIEQTGASTVVLGNPGCHAWIGQAAREHGGAVRVLHVAEFLIEALRGYPPKQ